MDVNGTRFHLIADPEDWATVLEIPTPEGGVDFSGTHALTLKPRLPVFPRGRRSALLDPRDRRGAASDRFGSWYWISHDQQSIMRAPVGSTRAVLYWQQTQPAPQSHAGAFVPHLPAFTPATLSGLTVTSHHYLVVGILDPAGLLIFDLHAGGEPVRLDFAGEVAFAPFDMTAAADGGLWVLDRANRRLWGLDRYFRVLPLLPPVPSPPQPGDFHSVTADEPPAGPPHAALPQPLPLPALDPIAVEALPDGSLLILDQPALFGGNSRIYHYRAGATPGALLPPAAPLPLPSLASVAADEDDRPVVAYDFALAPDAGPEQGLLYVVEQAGNQAIAYAYDLSPTSVPSLTAQAIYLPLHHFGGRSLARGSLPNGDLAVFYDVTPIPAQDLAVRWIRVHEIDEARYLRQGQVETGVFDSYQLGTTWHRLFVDGCIPPETTVQVWTRAGDDLELLKVQAYVREPDLYLRGRGAEIPFWQGGTGDPTGPTPITADAGAEFSGTWELLFQHAVGQYIQIKLMLTGNGRASPQIDRLRVYYPRFSYVTHYLPAAYQEEDAPGTFLERFLANMEGFYSDLEGKIAAAGLLVDPRAAPADALDWLATWLGVLLDPLWAKVGTLDRRRLLIRFAHRLYARRGTPDGLRFALMLLLDPCLETTLAQLQDATVVPNLALRQELAALGLPYPTRATGEAELEELLWRYVLAAPGRSRVRIVERWQSRQGMALAAGDVTLETQTDDDLQAAMEAAKHRFSVLVPEDLPAEHAAMVDKIIRLQKPVHTDYDVRRFWDLFLVGQVRLGLDTILGEEGRFLPIILGRDYLAEGYLEAAHPMNIAQRAISDRDQLGDLRL